MIRPRHEQTLATACTVRGRGYWSGRDVQLRFLPASPASGIRFVRTDLADAPVCRALCDQSAGLPMRTNLRGGAAQVAMVEHVMAALYGLQIDNCTIEIDAEECPGMDGSSLDFVGALRSAGVVGQAAGRQRLIIDRRLRVDQGASWIEAAPADDGHPAFEYRLDYGPASPIPPQTFRSTLTTELFARAFAPARTFVTAGQAERLKQQGVGRHVTPRDLLIFDSHGLVGNSLRFDNECARHKALDLIGDLALCGVELIGHFVSHQGGHQLNAQMAQLLTRLAGNAAVSDPFSPPTTDSSGQASPCSGGVPWRKSA